MQQKLNSNYRPYKNPYDGLRIGDAAFAQLIKLNDEILKNESQGLANMQTKYLQQDAHPETCSNTNLRTIKKDPGQQKLDQNPMAENQDPAQVKLQNEFEESKNEVSEIQKKSLIDEATKNMQNYYFGDRITVGKEMSIGEAKRLYPVKFKRSVKSKQKVHVCQGEQLILKQFEDQVDLMPKTNNFVIFQIKNNLANTYKNIMMCQYQDCMKTFNSWHNLLNHLRVHTNDKPFSCNEKGCGSKFAQKGNLLKHMRNYHNHKKRSRTLKASPQVTRNIGGKKTNPEKEKYVPPQRALSQESSQDFILVGQKRRINQQQETMLRKLTSKQPSSKKHQLRAKKN